MIKRKLIFQKLIDEMISVPDELHTVVNGGVVSLAAKSLGSLGGKATLEKYGKEHFSNAGKKGAEKRWGKKS